MIENDFIPNIPVDWFNGETYRRLPTREEIPTDDEILCSQGIRDIEMPRPHRYLPWINMCINWCAFDRDIISYPFTGCIMALAEDATSLKVYHVDTGGNGYAKSKWLRMIYNNQVQVIRSFKPAKCFSDKEIAGGIVIGIITNNQDCYSVLLERDSITNAIKVKKKVYISNSQGCCTIM